MPLYTFKTSSSLRSRYFEEPRRGALIRSPALIPYGRAPQTPLMLGAVEDVTDQCPHHEECSDESEPSKLTKTSRVKDLVEMVRKRIHEDTTTLWRLRIVHPVSFEFSSFRRNHVLWIPEAVRDTELRVIHRSNRSRLAPSILSGQDCDPLSRRQSHVLDVSLQSQGHGLRLVLLFLVTVFSKL